MVTTRCKGFCILLVAFIITKNNKPIQYVLLSILSINALKLIFNVLSFGWFLHVLKQTIVREHLQNEANETPFKSEQIHGINRQGLRWKKSST